MIETIGNDAARAELDGAIVAGDAIHHAWLLAGPRGVGKGQVARAAAARLLSRAAPGASVEALLAAGSHPDYRELVRLPKDAEKPDQDLARSITVAQVRSLQPMFATKPALSPRRVVVIDAIDDLERSGANALLKSLEEPPQGTIFLLVSHMPGRLLPTIRSRCRLLRFSPLAPQEVARVVRTASPELDEDEVQALVKASEGSPGRALQLAGLGIPELANWLAAIARTGDPSNAVRSRLARSFAGKTTQPRYEAFLGLAPAFIAAEARGRAGERLRTALDSYEEARTLAATALAQTLDPQGTVFEIAGLVARLGRSETGSITSPKR